MKVDRRVIDINGSWYIPLSKEHAAHIGVDEKNLAVILEDFTKSRGPFLAVYKKNNV